MFDVYILFLSLFMHVFFVLSKMLAVNLSLHTSLIFCKSNKYNL